MFSKSNLIKIGFNTLIGVSAIILWLQFVDLESISGVLNQANYYWLLPATFFLWLSQAIKAYKLKYFLAPIKNISLSDMIALNGVALLLNFFIPIRAGELGKGLYLNKTYSIPVSKSVVWIFIDRFLDFLVIFILTPVLLLFVPTTLGTSFLIISTMLALTFTIITYLTVFKKNLSTKLLYIFTQFLVFGFLKRSFQKVYLHFLEMFQILNRPIKDLSILGLLSVLSYVADAAVFYFSFLSINSDQSFLNMLLAQLLSALTFLIPAAPGYVGSLEASGLVIFTGVLGIEQNLGSGMMILFHALTAVFAAFWGLVCLYALKLNLGTLIRKAN